MANMIATVIVWALSSFVARLISAFGISFVTYSTLSTLIDKMIAYIQPNLLQLPKDILNIISLTGVGEALTLMASALATRAAFISARVFITASRK